VNKRIIETAVRKGLQLALVLVCSATDGQGIQNSHHDFTKPGWNSPLACSPCHLPKTAATDSLHFSLWTPHSNHAGYDAFTTISNEQNYGQPNGKSKFCLSCHDGTVAVDKHTSFELRYDKPETGMQWVAIISEHPVSVLYDTSKSYSVLLRNPATSMSGLGGTIGQDLLEEGKVECTSCHDVHVSRNKEGCTGCHGKNTSRGAVIEPLSLWMTNRNSALCLTCHQK